MSNGTVIRQDLRLELLSMGQTFTLTRITPGAYDADTQITAAATEDDYEGIGRLGNYSDTMMASGLVLETDRRLTWQPDDEDFIPEIGDRVTVGNDVYSVINVKVRELEGDWICYTMQVR